MSIVLIGYENAVCSIPDDVHVQMIEHCYNGLTIERVHEDSPMPWDAGFEIEGDELRIKGWAGPGGFGACSVTVPKANSVYVVVADAVDPEDFVERFHKVMTERGYALDIVADVSPATLRRFASRAAGGLVAQRQVREVGCGTANTERS